MIKVYSLINYKPDGEYQSIVGVYKNKNDAEIIARNINIFNDGNVEIEEVLLYD